MPLAPIRRGTPAAGWRVHPRSPAWPRAPAKWPPCRRARASETNRSSDSGRAAGAQSARSSTWSRSSWMPVLFLLHAGAAPFEKQVLQPAAQGRKTDDLASRLPDSLDHAALFLHRNRYADGGGAHTGGRGCGVDAAELSQRNTAQLNLHPIGFTLKILERSQTNQVALVEKGDAVADVLHLGQLVGTEENALAGVARVAQQFPYLKHSRG